MKKLIIGLMTIFSSLAFAHEIEGTQILSGATKTKITLNGLKTTCYIRIDKVKNLMLEDSFGNPAYNVQAFISLDAKDFSRNRFLNFSKEVWFKNLFETKTGTEVRDFEYSSADGETLKISREGRVATLTIPYDNQKVTCSF